MKTFVLNILRPNLLVFICIFFNWPVALSQKIPINIGDNVSGILESPGDVIAYSFCSAAYVPVYIRASSNDISNLKIELYDQNELLVPDLPSTLDFISSSGEYTILVKSKNGDEQGKFFLSLQRTINPPAASALNCNSTIIDSLNFVTEAKPFTLSVTSGTTIFIMLSSSDISNKRLEVYTPSGQKIIEHSSISVAGLSTTLDQVGCYTVFVMSQNGNEMGVFSLTLNTLLGECTPSICFVNEICDNQIDDDEDGLIDCEDEDCCNMAGCITGLDDFNFEESIKIFPNPSNGVFNIAFGNFKEYFKFQLFNINGQNIFVEKELSNQIQIKNIAKGIYYFRGINDDFQFTKKIIIHKNLSE